MAFQSPGFLNQEARDRLALQQQAKEMQMKSMQFAVENYNKQKKQKEEMSKDYYTLMQGQERLKLMGQRNTLLTEKNKREVEQHEFMRSQIPGFPGGQPAQPSSQQNRQGFAPEISSIGARPTLDFDTQKEIATRSLQLQEKFNKIPEVEEFRTIRSQVQQMDALLENSKKGDQRSNLALDQGLVITFNKVLDPNSVVRESEFARTPQGLSFTGRFQAAYDKFKKGGVGLTNRDREDLVKGAKIIADSRGIQFNKIGGQFARIADQLKVPRNIVLAGEKPYKPFFQSEQNNTVNKQNVQADEISQSVSTLKRNFGLL